MARSKKHLLGAGCCVWLAVLVGSAVWARSILASQESRSGGSLIALLMGSHTSLPAVDPVGALRAGDPLFAQQESGNWEQVGHVKRPSEAPPGQVELVWYAGDPGPRQYVQHRNDGSLESVLSLMLPVEKRELIQQRLAAAVNRHGEELSAALLPLVESSIRQSLPVIEQELRASLARHDDEVDRLLEHYNRHYVDQHLIPLAQQELLPIVRRHGAPVANEIGRELWDRASLWSFGWRAVYDRSPLPSRNLVQQEWIRFVEQEAAPVVETHLEKIVAAVQSMLRDLAASEAVQSRLATAAAELADDPQTRELVAQLLRDSLLENEQLRVIWREVWSSDQAQRAFRLAGDRLEPVVRQIGDDLFGTPEGGIDPDFARVLRNQIFGKDRRWVVALPLASPAVPAIPVIEPADRAMPFPLVYMAGGRR